MNLKRLKNGKTTMDITKMKVYVIINLLGCPSTGDVIEHIFLKEEDAIQMLDSFDDHCGEEFKIEEHQLIE